MTPAQWAFAAATAALVVACVRGVPAPDWRRLGHPALWGAGLLLLLTVGVRAALVQPTLVHADRAAPELVDCILQFPAPCATRGATYGQYGFLVTGALARLFGRDLNAVFWAMQLVGVLDVALLAILAGRLSGSPYAALIAVAVTGTNPIFLRVAASEDMHNVGLALALLALVAMDVFAASRRTAALMAATLALALMVHTRQTFYAFVPCAFVLALGRGGRGLARSRAFLAAGAAVVAVLVVRVTRSEPGNVLENMVAILGEPVLLPTLLRHHALVDVPRFGVLAMLTLPALVWACLAGRLARAAAIAFVVNFLLTLPCGMPSPGVELAQRLPAFATAMLLVALAGAALLESRVRPSRRAIAGLTAAGALFVVQPVFPGWNVLRMRTPIHREYLAVQAAAAMLPRQIMLVTSPIAAADASGGLRYAGLLRRLGKTIRTVPADEPAAISPGAVFLEGVDCWTYSFNELAALPGESRDQVRWDYVLFGRQPSPLRPPAGIRPECRPFVEHGTPVGAVGVIADPPDDPPFLFYSAPSVPVRFLTLHAAT